MEIDRPFRSLYETFWPRLESLLWSHPQLSPPLLLNPPTRYYEQPRRLFVIGQETHTWYNDRLRGKTGGDAIDTLMTIYRDEFRLGLNRPSVFWQTVRGLEQRFGIEPGAILWSNLNKVDENGGPLSPDLEAEVLQRFPVLPQEVRLATADVVVFFSGPRYDRPIELTFSGVRFEPVALPEPSLLRVIHPALPVLSFRTYHPKYLRLSKASSNVLAHVAMLCSSGGSSNPPLQPIGSAGG